MINFFFRKYDQRKISGIRQIEPVALRHRPIFAEQNAKPAGQPQIAHE